MFRKRIGSMECRFESPTCVAVADKIPDGTSDINYPVWFSFLTAGKLLYNFPDGSGQSVTEDAVRRLTETVAADHERVSTVGACSGSGFKVVDSVASPQVVYRSDLRSRRGVLWVVTKIGHGDEDYFHRATIDVTFDQARRRLGEYGHVLQLYMLGFFENLAEHGCSEIERNMAIAASSASLA